MYQNVCRDYLDLLDNPKDLMKYTPEHFKDYRNMITGLISNAYADGRLTGIEIDRIVTVYRDFLIEYMTTLHPPLRRKVLALYWPLIHDPVVIKLITIAEYTYIGLEGMIELMIRAPDHVPDKIFEMGLRSIVEDIELLVDLKYETTGKRRADIEEVLDKSPVFKVYFYTVKKYFLSIRTRPCSRSK